jgi:hypothetical protein
MLSRTIVNRNTSRLLLLRGRSNNNTATKSLHPDTVGVARTSTQLPSLSLRWHGGSNVSNDAETIEVTFLQPNETTKTVAARVGETFLQVAHRNDIDLEGACEGTRMN